MANEQQPQADAITHEWLEGALKALQKALVQEAQALEMAKQRVWATQGKLELVEAQLASLKRPEQETTDGE